LRRLIIFLTLITLLLAMFSLSRTAADWHYVIRAEPGTLLYAALFESDPDDWETYAGRREAVISGGALRIRINTQQDGAYSAAFPYFEDFDLRVAARLVDGAPQDGYGVYGVVFRQRDRDNYYSFLLSGDGFYRVTRTIDRDEQILSNWNASPLINTGLGAPNDLRVIGAGDRFQFFINGQRVELCIPDNPAAISTPVSPEECQDGQWTETLIDASIRYGRVGVGVVVPLGEQPGTTAEFDHVLVYSPLPLGE